MTPSPRDHGPSAGGGPVLLDSRYQIVRTLGRGGMGQVYEGVHTVLGKPVAIKVLNRQLAADERSRKRLLREARAASAIHHQGVVEIIDFGETPHGAVFLVMELLQGRDLGAIIAKGPLPWPRARELLRQAAGALAVAHAQGIIHRDIKPANCFVVDGPDGEVIKLLDFGIAKIDDATDSTTGLTATGEIMGTASYMAPELTFGTPAGVATDVYALGIMAYELLTGAPPFRGKNPYDVLKRHIEEEPPPVSSVVAGVPPALEAVVRRAIAKKPEARFSSMTELEAALVAVSAPGAEPMVALARDGGSADRMGPMGTARFTGVVEGPAQTGATMALATSQMVGPASASASAAPMVGPASASAVVPSMPSSSRSPIDGTRPPSGGRVGLAIVAAVLLMLGAVGLGAWLLLRGS